MRPSLWTAIIPAKLFMKLDLKLDLFVPPQCPASGSVQKACLALVHCDCHSQMGALDSARISKRELFPGSFTRVF